MQASAFDGAAWNFQQQPGVVKQRIRSLEHESGRQSDAAFQCRVVVKAEDTRMDFFFKSQNMVWSQKISASEVGKDDQAELL